MKQRIFDSITYGMTGEFLARRRGYEGASIKLNSDGRGKRSGSDLERTYSLIGVYPIWEDIAESPSSESNRAGEYGQRDVSGGIFHKSTGND